MILTWGKSIVNCKCVVRNGYGSYDMLSVSYVLIYCFIPLIDRCVWLHEVSQYSDWIIVKGMDIETISVVYCRKGIKSFSLQQLCHRKRWQCELKCQCSCDYIVQTDVSKKKVKVKWEIVLRYMTVKFRGWNFLKRGRIVTTVLRYIEWPYMYTVYSYLYTVWRVYRYRTPGSNTE